MGGFRTLGGGAGVFRMPDRGGVGGFRTAGGGIGGFRMVGEEWEASVR